MTSAVHKNKKGIMGYWLNTKDSKGVLLWFTAEQCRLAAPQRNAPLRRNSMYGGIGVISRKNFGLYLCCIEPCTIGYESKLSGYGSFGAFTASARREKANKNSTDKKTVSAGVYA